MTDKDKVLSVRELQRCMSDEVKIAKLSKLICKHSSEWNMSQNFDTFKQEIEAIYAKGIEQEEEEGQRQDLETARDEKIALLKEKIEKLSFWDKVQDGPITEKTTDTSKEEEPSRFSIMQEITTLKQAQHTKKQEAKEPKRTFPVSNDNVYHFHPIAFVEHMKLISTPKYNPDHGDWHDPIINPQVRGHYPYQTGIHSEHKGWDTDRSRAIKRRTTSSGSTRKHHGLDIYAPIGTPIYACNDAIEIQRHTFEKKARGFNLKFTTKFKNKRYIIGYCHMIEFEEKVFRLAGSIKEGDNYKAEEYTYESCLTTQTIYFKNKKGNNASGKGYEVTYSPSANTLTIDKMVVDLEIAKKIYKTGTTDLFKKGDIVGYVGMTGNAVQHRNTAHLHLFMYDTVEGKEKEPMKLLKDYINNEEEGDTMSKQDGFIPSSQW